MKKGWWIFLGGVLAGILPWLIKLIVGLFGGGTTSTSAQTIVEKGEQEKARIKEELKSASDENLATRFNQSIKKEEK